MKVKQIDNDEIVKGKLGLWNLEMSKPEPIYKAPYKVVWDNSDCCDSYECESLEQAKESAKDTLIDWMVYQSYCSSSDYEEWDEKEIEDWDYMIENSEVCVYKYDPMKDEYEMVWEPSDEELREICWLPYEELRNS